MAKKGILVLLMLAFMVLVGCEEGGNGAISPLDVYNITNVHNLSPTLPKS